MRDVLLAARRDADLHRAGYFRVACIVYAFAAADRHPTSCLLVYFVGFACDELDGRFARMLDQRSRLGAVLDMATDRVATAGLLALLCKFAPAYSLLWALLIVLDVSSHWFQMYATLACGDTTHKVRPPAPQAARSVVATSQSHPAQEAIWGMHGWGSCARACRRHRRPTR